jgi:hypothetical protein
VADKASEPDALDRLLTDLLPGDAEKVIRHRAWIGQIAGLWAAFEHSIDSFAINLAGIPADVGYCFTSQVIGPARKLDAYIALARLCGAERFIKELNKFAESATALAERRNRAIHDPWLLFDGRTLFRVEITARRVLRNRIVPVSESEMEKLVDDLEALQLRFVTIHENIKSSIGK